MQQALIIFVRHPEPGKVKTRLAVSLGNDMAVAIYKKLLQHTLTITQTVAADKYVFYADEIVEADIWQHDQYFKLRQAKGNLGERMRTAFDTLLKKGYHKVCIVGSDCYELSSEVIHDAFCRLNENEIVVGPARDGGYYLLGMKKLYLPIFGIDSWSTDRVLADTLREIERLHLSCSSLGVLSDVDEASDVPASWLSSK